MKARNWSLAATTFSAVLLATLAAYRETVSSFIQVWSGSETFAHGFLIVPISAYLIWMKRHELSLLAPRPYPLALLILPLLAFAWLAGHATSTLVVEQAAFIAFLPALVLVHFGPRVSREIMFPLGFLFFAVPFGDVLLPRLMDVTATLAMRALVLTGVPVSREGLFLTTPVGQWEVVEACSGLRYLVSGFALGCLFAYVTYRKTWKRLAFAGLSIGVLILANGFRAYALILVGYLSEMRIGRGFDHYALGWLVYIIVLISFFAAGSAFRDHASPGKPGSASMAGGLGTPPSVRMRGWIAVAGVSLLVLAFWPTLFTSLARHRSDDGGSRIAPPAPLGGWAIGSGPAAGWRPHFAGASSETTLTYVKAGAAVQCYLAFFEHQGQGRELIQHRSVIAGSTGPEWRASGERDRRVLLGRGSLVVRETDVRGADAHVVVWHWYWFPDEFTANPAWAKLLQAKASLLQQRDHAAAIVLSAPALPNRVAAEDLSQFVTDMLPSIQLVIHEAGTPH